MNVYFKLLTGLGIFVAQVAFAGYGTNSFFVTLDERQNGHPNLEQIEASKTNIECRPSEEDLAGHWGEEINEQQLSIRVAKNTFQINEPVIIAIIYRNVGTNNDLYCSWVFGGDLDFKVIIKDENGNELPDSFIAQRVSLPVVEKWLSGTQYKYYSNLTQRYGLSKPGIYLISVRRKIRMNDSSRLINLDSGVVTVKLKE